MRIETTIGTVLQLLDRPAFSISDDMVCEVNRSAANRMIQPGMPFSQLYSADPGVCRNFVSGQMMLTLNINGSPANATGFLLEQTPIFVLDPPEDPHLQAFALAAQELRLPLSQVMAVSEPLFSSLSDDPHTAGQLARVNRSLHQILRIVGNMSDAGATRASRMELRDATAVFREIFDRMEPLCEQAGMRVTFHNHPVPVYTLLDVQKMERAVYNLLSNAARHAPSGGEILIKFSRRDNSLSLSVENTGCEGTPQPIAELFGRYRREPGMDSVSTGLGLGLTLVRSAATAHQGILLLDHTKEGNLSATIRFPVRQKSFGLSSPMMRIDYAGERDHGLVELSEILPPESYLPK